MRRERRRYVPDSHEGRQLDYTLTIIVKRKKKRLIFWLFLEIHPSERERRARSSSGSSLSATVRKSKRTRSSTILAMTGGCDRRRAASIWFGVSVS